MIKIHRSNEDGTKKVVYEDSINVVNICTNPMGVISLSSTLQEACPYCSDADCYLNCESSHEALNGNQDAAADLRQETEDRASYNSVIEGIERMLMAMAGAGVDMSDLKIAEAVFTAAEGASQ